MKNSIFSLVIFSFWIFLNGSILAQTKTGTTLAQFLKIEPGARNSVLNSAAVSGDVSAVFENPASLAGLSNYQVQFTYSSWLAGISYNYLALSLPLSGGLTAGMHLTALNSGEIDVRTVEQPLGTGERYDAASIAVGAAIAAKLTDRVAVGLELNYIHEQIWHSSYNTMALDMGVQYEIYHGGPVLGASLSNFGPRSGFNGRDFYIDYDFNGSKNGDNNQIPAELRSGDYPLPTLFRVGLSYPLQINKNNRLLLAVDALHPNDNTESVNAALEWRVADYLALRAGYRNLFQQDLQGGLVAGMGIYLNWMSRRFSIDYSWADYGVLNSTQRFTLGFLF